jgi:CheY-like chemotaxis protein
MASVTAEKRTATGVFARRILIVDDFPDLAEGLAKWLRFLGNEVEVAFDGLCPITAAEKFRPDIVLLDIGLPDIDGCEVAKNIREKPWGRDIVLVAMTGHRDKEDRRRMRTSGFHAHLVKPLVYKQVISLLASCPVAATSFPQSDS